MTTKPSITTTQPDNYVRLPDAPKPEDMNNFKYLHLPGNTHHWRNTWVTRTLLSSPAKPTSAGNRLANDGV